MPDLRKKLKIEASDAPAAVLHFPDGAPGQERRAVTEVYANAAQKVAVVREEPQHRVMYVGVTERDVKMPCRYVLGVFHKRKRSLKLMPVLGDAVMRMEPRVEGFQYKPSEMSTIGDGNERENRIAGNRAALSTFGNASLKKKIKANAIQGSATEALNTGDAIESLVDAVTTQAKEQGLTKEQVKTVSNHANDVSVKGFGGDITDAQLAALPFGGNDDRGGLSLFRSLSTVAACLP